MFFEQDGERFGISTFDGEHQHGIGIGMWWEHHISRFEAKGWFVHQVDDRLAFCLPLLANIPVCKCIVFCARSCLL